MKNAKLRKDWRDAYVNRKNEVRELTRRIMLNNMVADNLADLIPKSKWDLQSHGWQWMRYYATEGTTVADLDKLGAKLAKAFGKEPSISVTKDYVVFTFWLYPNMGDKKANYPNISLDFCIGNTEKCDFVETEVLEKRYEPTGYCKQLKERLYLTKPQHVPSEN